MKSHALLRVSGMTLLAVAVSLAIMGLVYILQHAQLLMSLATVTWNGAGHY